MTGFWRRGRREAPPPNPGDLVPARPWDRLHGTAHAELAGYLDESHRQGWLTDVDHLRIGAALERATGPAAFAEVVTALRTQGVAAFCHASGQRDLPDRMARHLLPEGQVMLGVSTRDPRNPPQLAGHPFAVDTAMLCTSMLVVGPPGSGKTRSFAEPVTEHLCLRALANQASVVVIDPKGDDFATPGWFDIDIDLARPDGPWGLDLFGGSDTPDQGADRLASALLPPDVSADAAYFADASKNALYQALAPFHAAHQGRFPGVRQLLALLRGEERALQSLTDRLKARGLLEDHRHLLAARAAQRERRDDPAASLIERLGLLDRPVLTELLDGKKRTFSMDDLNRPLRVRLGLPEGLFPEAARMLARLAVAQFVQFASSPKADPAIFKGLVIDEAGRFIDEYVARGVQRVRSRNAGLILLTQSLGDIPEQLRPTIFGSVGCKAVFAGVDPTDAAYFADSWGTHWVTETTASAQHGVSEDTSRPGRSTTWTPNGASYGRQGAGTSEGTSRSWGSSARQVERYLWSPSEIINSVPTGHALVSLARPDGVRVPPTLVNLRA
ncbi:TraM recognition domain-containing protein [Actinomadura sp. DSM 109109]|nr:TraM recognition domain-containing protein [Actinomadura lepetitiana]